MNKLILTSVALAAGFLAAAATPRSAYACGCFAQSNPAVPVVQAGERIVFAQDGGEVEMHVQIRYDGEAEEFGWLLPVPEVPELSSGSDELFRSLLVSTQPVYALTRTVDFAGCRDFNGNGNGRGDAGSPPVSGAMDMSFGSGGEDPDSPLVKREFVGPFDTAVLDASDKQAMIGWLDDNGYVVTDDPNDPVIDQYTGEGRYFVALKLRADAQVGDLQPLVLQFRSEAASIPIKLTRVGATPDMPVLVWVFGDARAIPSNYRHTRINPGRINWFTGARNYIDVVTQAVDEAPFAHSFVTEFSGSTRAAQSALGDTTRYGSQASLAELTDAKDFVQELFGRRGFPFNTIVDSILRQHIEYPEVYREEGIEEDVFYSDLTFYLTSSFARDVLQDTVVSVDAEAAAADLWSRIVVPARKAESLFLRFSQVTRLFTTLSPHEMTEDPVFAFNPDLPDVPRQRNATFTQVCNEEGRLDGRGWLELPDGRRFYTSPGEWSSGVGGETDGPFSTAIERLPLEGAPVVEQDFSESLRPSDPPSAGPGRSGNGGGSSPGLQNGAGGCTSVGSAATGLWVLLGAFVYAWSRRPSLRTSIRRD